MIHEDLENAAFVEPDGKTVYIVAWAHGSSSLKRGDEVVMIETPIEKRNVFLRGDNTLHAICPNDYYIMVVKK